MSRSGLTHPRRDLRFRNEDVQLLGGNFYGRIFTRRELSSRRECYQDFTSQQDSRQDPGEEVFFLAGSRQVQISQRDSCRDTRQEFFPGRIPPGKRATSAGSRRDPGEHRESWRDPGTYFTRVVFGPKDIITVTGYFHFSPVKASLVIQI